MAATKAIFASKTVWFNIVAALTAYLNFLPPSVQPYLPYITAGVNIILRYLTNQPITLPTISVN